MVSFETQWDRQTIGLLQLLMQLAPHPGHLLLMFGLANQIARLPRVSGNVVEFVCVPDAVVLDQFETISSQAEHRGRLRKLRLPVILLPHSPFNCSSWDTLPTERLMRWNSF